ncbi:hypothetical protein FF80_02379 [Devosia sp. LC5]|nr:hypothetical protein FF80_02379 [Devosia sp. LC5]
MRAGVVKPKELYCTFVVLATTWFIVITRLVRVIHCSALAEAWIARTSRAMTMEWAVSGQGEPPAG